MKTLQDKKKAGILGLVVGDALGVPVEFELREYRDKKPVKEMLGYGTFNMPKGTWSDDSSLTLCLLDAINKAGISDKDKLIHLVAQNFIAWLKDSEFTANNEVFDVGTTTLKALTNLLEGVSPYKSGCTGERDNGNGALMRILPLSFYHEELPLNNLIELVHLIGSITHAHLRSNTACGIYTFMAIELLKGKSLQQAYEATIIGAKQFYSSSLEFAHFKPLLSGNIHKYKRYEISSSVYVVSTLEAAFWCLLNSSSYSDAVLKAVNLGGDTDTIAAITGGLAAIHYGIESIPEHWLNQIVRLDLIIDLIG